MDLQLHLGINFLQYADDIVVYSSSRKIGEAVANLQSSLNVIYLYLSNKGLELSPTKSKWILFSNRKRSLKENSIFKIFINNHLVERVLSVRFLGVILDRRLKGKNHFKQVKKEKSLINVL